MIENKKKLLIIPVEIAQRELTGRLLVCAEAIKHGWSCIVLTRRSLIRNIEKIPHGVALIKSAHNGDLEYIKLLSNYGHKIVCLDEEGLVQRNMDELVKYRSSIESIKLLDSYLTWGEAQRLAFVDEYPKNSDIFVVTGSTRADLWQGRYDYLYKDRVRELKQEYGEYILIPSCFAMYNHFLGFDRAADLVLSVAPGVDQDGYERELRYVDYIKTAYHAYFILIKEISENFPDVNIVMKIHPSENPDPWVEYSKKIDNFFVIESGALIEVIMGCKALIHCNSTSSIEAYLYGKPVISYCLDSKEVDHLLEITTTVSRHVHSQKNVVEMLFDLIIKQKPREKFTDIEMTDNYIEQLIFNYKNKINSSKLIFKEIEKLNAKKVDLLVDNIIGDNRKDSWKEGFITLISPLITFLRINRFMPAFYKRMIKGSEYGKRKYEGLDIYTIQKEFDLISRNESVKYKRVTQCSDDFFLIE